MVRFKQWLQSGQTVPTFALARLVHPVFVDMVAANGWYRGFWVDWEHASLHGDQLSAVTLAARANELDCFVRMPPTGYWQVTQCLEAGASGVMAAQIHSAEQAREFVSWCRFPPLGTRGLNTSGRDADYTHVSPAEFAEQANRDVLVGIQIETSGAVAEVDDLAALDGVDFLFVGPSDLSMALGVVGQFHHEKLWTAIEQISAACRRQRIAWGAVLPDPQFAARALELGCQMPTMGNDAAIIRNGVQALCQAFGPTLPNADTSR